MKNKKDKRKNKSFFYLVLLGLLGGLIGGLSSAIFSGPLKLLSQKGPDISRWLMDRSGHIFCVTAGLLALGGLASYFYGKKEFLASIQKEEDLYKETWLSISTALFSTGSLALILLYAWSLQAIGVRRGDLSLTIQSGVLIGAIYLFVVMQKKIVTLIKKGYPEKEGDPYDFTFAKEWMSSMDEREKKETYYAGFKAYQAMNYIYLAIAIILIFLGMHMTIQGLTFLVLGVLILSSNCIYFYQVISRRGEISHDAK